MVNAGGRRRVMLCGAAAAALTAAGCAPPRPALFDAQALAHADRLIVLPLADGPGPKAKGSGAVLRGAAIRELLHMPDVGVLNVTDDQLQETLTKLGFAVQDCYDPAVAAEVGRALGVDAVVTGEVTHYDTQQEQAQTTVMIVTGGGTDTIHWVSAALRVVRSKDGRIIYTGRGCASHPEGYTQAAQTVCKQALASLKYFLEHEKKSVLAEQ